MNGTHRKHRSGSFVFNIRQTLLRRATSAFGKLRRGIAGGNRRRLRAVCVDGPETLDFNGFSNGQGIFKFNAKISDRAVHFCVPQQKLNGAKVACFLVDLSDLRAPH
ncbi:hypothetical protein TRL7639_00875 [Falsiruegeria litorea R37]|uniref:Uncharacterized protein n=1 Tax=Falsiruegeria litorea R37 TaxID=1200284 RepID=A0A1Y5RTU2_9RHOB|nr:hypothetical protein TRL7639_00875 [Falsiruegeria litorea R37]